MKTRTLIIVGLFLLLGAYAASGAIRATAPGHPEVKITPPPAGLAPEVAAFSGIWDGARDGVLPNRLIVEKIHANWATIVYTWADDPTGNFKAGWARVRAKVLPDGTLHWGYPGKFTVKLVNDGTNIEGKKEQAGGVSTFTLKKVGLAAAQ